MSLLQVMLIVVLIGAFTATGFQILKSQREPSRAVSTDTAMAWADHAVAAFSAANSRLPCPASNPQGEEDCGSGANRGYLPTRSLDTFFDAKARSAIGVSGNGTLPGPILYAVGQPQAQNAETLSLTQAGGWYQPMTYDDTTYATRETYEREDEEHPYDAINGLDFCMAMARLSAMPFNGGRLHVTPASQPENIAYAVGISGLSKGATDPLEKGSSDNAIKIKGDRDALTDNEYGQVRVRTLSSLAQSVGCDLFAQQTLSGPRPTFADTVPVAALDLAADALDLNEQVEDTESDTLDSADENLDAAKTAMLMASISTGMAAISTVTAGLKIGEDSILLSLHSLRCVVTLGVECWRVPITSTALGLDIAALVAAGTAFVATATEAGLTGKALSDALSVQRMAAAAAEPATVNLAEALKQSYDAIYGDCSTRDADGACSVIGTQQNLQTARDKLTQATAKTTSFYNQYLMPWDYSQLMSRTPGCNNSSTSSYCVNARDALYSKLVLARKLVDEMIILDDLKGRLKGYQDQRKQIDEMLKPSGAFAESTAKYCAGTSEQDQRSCAANRESVEFARTCVRNGVLHQYSGNNTEQVPLCYARVDEAIVDINKKIKAQQVVYDKALAASNAAHVTLDVSRVWVDPVYDADGALVTAGYYKSASPYAFRYPSNWTYCSAGTDKIEGCSSLLVYWNYWQSGDYLPLVRTKSNQKWFSYGDAYRTHLNLKADQEAAQRAVAEAEEADRNAKDAYARLLAVATDDGSGANVELWIGPHEILKAMDDRGAIGPDRNGTAKSEVNP